MNADVTLEEMVMSWALLLQEKVEGCDITWRGL